RGSTSRGSAAAPQQGYDYPGRSERQQPGWQGEVAQPPANAPARRGPVAASAEEAFAWVMGELKAQGGLLPSMLEKTKPRLRPDGDALVLVLSASTMLFGQIESPRNREAIATLMGQALGASVELRFERMEPREASSGPASGASASSVYEEPLVKFAQRELGAQIMQQ
ncbi:MAG: hypothetical protein KDD82_14215, partial [Planctomycetes bacterium]|nr:hypothetical protein [Planctomycetota bacterium]